MNNLRTILIVEDDKNLLELYQAALSQEGYQVLAALNADQALSLMEDETVHLVLTDIMMPKIDGYSLVETIKLSYPQIPIIMVTAKSEIQDKKLGFQLGIDDYMVKPIDIVELSLRVAALLKRTYQDGSDALSFKHCLLDPQSLTIQGPDQVLELPLKEFQILYKLLANPQQIFTRQQIMDDIWGAGTESDERTVDVHIRRLRSRLLPHPDFDILTVRGLGYKAVVL